ncbi:unnamed protein product [Brassica oleracea var. botrytis]|uniref:(rape) hypothetical protein n=1 Tax=Brassica napus TaxID=3708 RepID=A0A816UMW0_BRANA|nr:unnamed protein product [Brassica napus]
MSLVFPTMPRKNHNLGFCRRMFNTILCLLHSANSLMDRLCLRFCIANHNEKATYFKSCTK